MRADSSAVPKAISDDDFAEQEVARLVALGIRCPPRGGAVPSP
ncbi:hypothetical protein QCN29_10045 [Streptomyces sp. HNM0663]|uniref:Uncharacterized protein n=1 Tax=Streptomyces chengmaiensis TaxID=3040919 RepID=A0ABT6HM40_9ACTN|nr:hypothetical protein [Streptomyces chengmaiensis]MDH2389124.1 hypothetical protein [Streptomyces chengmaiensis]